MTIMRREYGLLDPFHFFYKENIGIILIPAYLRRDADLLFDLRNAGGAITGRLDIKMETNKETARKERRTKKRYEKTRTKRLFL